mmetsp:Transcript_4666/g.6980  ORF Transcript_4666/g.6980 Transcript_4666/m.6980 type:complete len:185 (-) Transcript_4666:261-815(-)|eukprot:CAMPEP_0113941940 /NCGR_PEP_ID=MMETSP1339-20121228/7761_1 /TAXON_ID=94617 /ORGANISM="Fibrocapsa japonica" /LENGTH=184 /DNA_ID=CAMNT_0000946227 /DNA_START=102 /DNA_END=656 /DNA_ORIENTATION=- /assembly_acc=CAM_ASM_000762
MQGFLKVLVLGLFLATLNAFPLQKIGTKATCLARQNIQPLFAAPSLADEDDERRKSPRKEYKSEMEVDQSFTVDWDAELKNLNRGNIDLSSRPKGAGDYSDLEIKTMQAQQKANEITDKFVDAVSNVSMPKVSMPKVPSKKKMKQQMKWSKLSTDIRFWLVLLGGISVLTAVIDASSRSQQYIV